jgi:hypothetical protein
VSSVVYTPNDIFLRPRAGGLAFKAVSHRSHMLEGARPPCGKQVASARYSPRNAVTTTNDRDVVAHQIDRRIPIRAFSLAR